MKDIERVVRCSCGNLAGKKVSILTGLRVCGRCYKKPINRKSLAKSFSIDLLKRATPSAKKFSRLLKKSNTHFIPEKIITNNSSFYIIDFFIPHKNLCIELDGGYHNTETQKRKDSERDEYLLKMGYQVWRMTNETSELLSQQQLISKIESFPDTAPKKKIRILAPAEEKIKYPKFLKHRPKRVKVRKINQTKIKTHFPLLDEIAKNKQMRELKRQPLTNLGFP